MPVVFRGGNGIAHQLGATHSHRMESVYARIPGLIVVAPEHARTRPRVCSRAPSAATTRSSSSNPKRCSTTTARCPTNGLHAPARRRQRRARRARTSRSSATAARSSASCGPAVDALVNDHGIDVELIDVRTLRPLDVNTIVDSVKKTNRCVIVDEDWGYCGMGSGILYQIHKPVLRLPRRPDRVRPQRRDPRPVQPLPRRSDDAERGPDRGCGEGRCTYSAVKEANRPSRHALESPCPALGHDDRRARS